jgi:hypothetical protein
MKSSDLILLAPAIAFAGGLTGLITAFKLSGRRAVSRHIHFPVCDGVAAFGALFLLVAA